MKEAVVFIVDANPSMNLPYPQDTVKAENESGLVAKMTRLECAKQALVSMISELMLKSKTNEVSVIVCKTALTQNHRIAAGVDLEELGDDFPYLNLTELTPGVVRPNAELLRRILEIETMSTDAAKNLRVRGSICDALILAADALYERGTKYVFQRKIVLITDAEHDVVLDSVRMKEMLVVIDQLRAMNCRLEVIGLEFASSAVYDEPASKIKHEDLEDVEGGIAGNNKKAKLEVEGIAVKEEHDSDTEDGSSDGIDDVFDIDKPVTYSSKGDREKLLISLTEKTGGEVIAAFTLQQVLDANRGKRIQTSVRTKFEFRVAPGLAFEARYFLMMSKQGFPTLNSKVVLVDDDSGEVMNDDLGEEMTGKIQKADLFVDEDNPDDIVDEDSRTKAIMFGSTLVPMSQFDYEGLKPSEMGARMEILGYMERENIPAAYVSGPPSCITGHDSQRACAAISALAQALEQLKKVAIATFYKRSTSARPVLVALFPLTEPEYPHPIRLVVLQIPFDGEVKKLDLDSLEDFLGGGDEQAANKSKVCDDLIESLMLPDGVLCSGQVPSPLLRSFNQTKVKRAMDPKAPIVKVRPTDDDRMVTPPEVMHRAESAMEAFEAAFPIETKSTEKATAKGQNGKKILTYKDFL